MTASSASPKPGPTESSSQSQPAADKPPDEITAIVFALMKAAGAINAQRQIKRYGRLKSFLWGAVVLILLLLVFLASRAGDHTFEQLLFATLFGGLATFAIAPPFLRLASKSPILFPLLATLIAVGLGFAASEVHGVWQHLLLELSVAIALVIALDQLFKEAIRRLQAKQASFSEIGKKWMALSWSEMEKALANAPASR